MENIEQIRQGLHEFIDSYIDELKGISDSEVITLADEEQLSYLSKIKIPKDSRDINEVIKEMQNKVYHYRAKLNHPRYLGFIPGPAALESWVGEVMTGAYNLHAGSWMSTSAASYIENRLVQWLASKAGYNSNQSGGLFVSGGSIANLTAVVSAREARISSREIHKAVAYVSEQTHSSLEKALKIAGISPQNIRIVNVNADFTMNMKDLEEKIYNDINQGLKPFMIIATSGSTNTGSIDPFREISVISKKYDLWMHVDGAYGASVLLSDKYSNLLDGIELSDSISWDGHKWLFQTYGCGIVLVKNKESLITTFNAHPEYLRDLKTMSNEINYMDCGIELTRPARALKLWFTIQTLGTDKISENIENGIHLAEYAKEILDSLTSWEIISEPSLAIVNFRYAPCDKTEEEKDRINEEISQMALKENYAGIFTTELNGKIVLRICSISPLTTRKDIEETIRRLDIYAKKIVGGDC